MSLRQRRFYECRVASQNAFRDFQRPVRQKSILATEQDAHKSRSTWSRQHFIPWQVNRNGIF